MSKHCFALYIHNLSEVLQQLSTNKLLIFKNPELHNRIVKILRLRVNDPIILFDKQIHTECTLHKQMFLEKRIVAVTVLNKKENVPLSPTITLFLPLLKKEAFEHLVYAATQMGITHINLIKTEKTTETWREEKEQTRLLNVMIAACEQSKQFVFPIIHKPITLNDIIKKESLSNTKKIYFEHNGTPLSHLVSDLKKNKYKNLIITFGPEGGFSPNEQTLLKNFGFSFYKLFPTILRSREAGIVGLGVVRSVIFEQKKPGL